MIQPEKEGDGHTHSTTTHSKYQTRRRRGSMDSPTDHSF